MWGRVLDGIRAEGAEARAAEADLAAARLATAGRAASGWVDLVEATQLSALAEEDLATRVRAETITQRRYEAGLADALAVRTARAQSASARAQLAAQKDQMLRAARQFEATLGRYPAGAAQAGADLPTIGAIPAPGAPVDLLARRPDVAAAEARLDAAGLRVWQARKALAPRLTLNAAAGAIHAGVPTKGRAEADPAGLHQDGDDQEDADDDLSEGKYWIHSSSYWTICSCTNSTTRPAQEAPEG